MTKSTKREETPNDPVVKAILEAFSEDGPPRNLPKEIADKKLAGLFEINELEAELGLPEGFFMKLMDEDDWSFVIKLHALFEASVTHLLVKHFNETVLDPVFSLLGMSNSRTGKLAFAGALKLIDADTERFIQKLSAMRNKFVHSVTNTNLQIKDFLTNLDSGNQKAYRKCLLLGYEAGKKIQIKHDQELYDMKAIVQLISSPIFDYLPKLSIWLIAAFCLSSIYKTAVLSDLRFQIQELDEIIASYLEKIVLPSQDAPSGSAGEDSETS